MSLTEADDIPPQPLGLLSEIVHYVRLVREVDPETGDATGPYHEVNAIVTATYKNGAALHIFVDPASPYGAVAKPETRTQHDPTGNLPDRWHHIHECTHR